MFNKHIIYPYKGSSHSARSVATGLGARTVKRNSKYHHNEENCVINWGNSRFPKWGTAVALGSMLNKVHNVRRAINKCETFLLLGSHIPEVTTNPQTACEWLDAPKFGENLNAVLCRRLTRSSGGRGIVLATRPEEIIDAQLYTRYVPKIREYRVHVSKRFGVIDVTQKRRRNLVELSGAQHYIRNHGNMWIFCHNNVNLPEETKQIAIWAVSVLGLDFGAVDIGWHPEYGSIIYEVNTAPGLEGTTLTCYLNMFKEYLNDNQL